MAGEAPPLRVATYNVSLFGEEAGGLIRRLEAGDADAARIAAVLQRVRPDLVLLNEFDYDPAHRAADRFAQAYLATPQPGGGPPLHYPYRYLAPVNTGVPSGLALDRPNDSLAPPWSEPTAAVEAHRQDGDAWGYGAYPGQFGMLLLSRYPIDAARTRTFQHLRWSVLPGATPPRDSITGAAWYAPEVWARLRLSSKSHWDVPVRTPQGEVHVLAAHPTPPVFDGPENRNGLRNAAEIRLWADYLGPGPAPWLCDDQGRCGGLPASARFVILGDYNADPHDGEGLPSGIDTLLRHPRVQAGFVPRSEGAAVRARQYGLPRRGDPAAHTGDFGPRTGTLRLDYVLPSTGWAIRGGGVFWPLPGTPEAELAAASDHHLVWLDLAACP